MVAPEPAGIEYRFDTVPHPRIGARGGNGGGDTGGVGAGDGSCGGGGGGCWSGLGGTGGDGLQRPTPRVYVNVTAGSRPVGVPKARAAALTTPLNGKERTGEVAKEKPHCTASEPSLPARLPGCMRVSVEAPVAAL